MVAESSTCTVSLHSVLCLLPVPLFSFPVCDPFSHMQSPADARVMPSRPLKRHFHARLTHVLSPPTAPTCPILWTREPYTVFLTWRHIATCGCSTSYTGCMMHRREQGRLAPAVWSDWFHRELVTGPRPAPRGCTRCLYHGGCGLGRTRLMRLLLRLFRMHCTRGAEGG